MKIEECFIVARESRLYSLIHRGFYYSDKGSCRKATKARYESHSTKCFTFAHNVIRKMLKAEGLNWDSWQIKIIIPCSNMEFYGGACNFKVVRKNHLITN